MCRIPCRLQRCFPGGVCRDMTFLQRKVQCGTQRCDVTVDGALCPWAGAARVVCPCGFCTELLAECFDMFARKSGHLYCFDGALLDPAAVACFEVRGRVGATGFQRFLNVGPARVTDGVRCRRFLGRHHMASRGWLGDGRERGRGGGHIALRKGSLGGKYRLAESVARPKSIQLSQRSFPLLAVLQHAKLPGAGGVGRHFPETDVQPPVQSVPVGFAARFKALPARYCIDSLTHDVNMRRKA